MWADGSFEVRSFDPGSWCFDYREQTITYARVAVHIGERQAVAFAYSQDSLRAACKVGAKSTVVSVEHVVALISTEQPSIVVSQKAKRSSPQPVQRAATKGQRKPRPNTYVVESSRGVTATTDQQTAWVKSTVDLLE